MSEKDLIAKTSTPGTVESLVADLRTLGVAEGDSLVVHSSLKAIGWVAGGAAAVVDALLEAVGPRGVVSMPAHSGDWSSPTGWGNPSVPESWWAPIINGRPPFDPYKTPLREMGAVAENLLMRRSTLRSAHPLHSHMAHGHHAEFITNHHPLDDSFGENSPLGRLYELKAKVLLVGVGHGQNTSLHLAEARATWPSKEKVEYASRIMSSNGPQLVTWRGDDVDADDFEELGLFLEENVDVAIGIVRQAQSRLADMQTLVDAAIPWFAQHRK